MVHFAWVGNQITFYFWYSKNQYIMPHFFLPLHPLSWRPFIGRDGIVHFGVPLFFSASIWSKQERTRHDAGLRPVWIRNETGLKPDPNTTVKELCHPVHWMAPMTLDPRPEGWFLLALQYPRQRKVGPPIPDFFRPLFLNSAYCLLSGDLTYRQKMNAYVPRYVL